MGVYDESPRQPAIPLATVFPPLQAQLDQNPGGIQTKAPKKVGWVLPKRTLYSQLEI